MPDCRSWAPPAAWSWSQLQKEHPGGVGGRTTAGQPHRPRAGARSRPKDKFAALAGPASPLPARAPGPHESPVPRSCWSSAPPHRRLSVPRPIVHLRCDGLSEPPSPPGSRFPLSISVPDPLASRPGSPPEGSEAVSGVWADPRRLRGAAAWSRHPRSRWPPWGGGGEGAPPQVREGQRADERKDGHRPRLRGSGAERS